DGDPHDRPQRRTPEAMLRRLGIDYQPLHPEALPGRLTAEALREMTVNEFLTGFSAAPRGFSMTDVDAVDPVGPGTVETVGLGCAGAARLSGWARCWQPT